MTFVVFIFVVGAERQHGGGGAAQLYVGDGVQRLFCVLLVVLRGSTAVAEPRSSTSVAVCNRWRTVTCTLSVFFVFGNLWCVQTSL